MSADPRGGELDRERQTVEPLAQRRDRRVPVAVGDELRLPLPRPLDEQTLRVLRPSASSRQTVSPFTLNDSRLVARIRKPSHEHSNDDVSCAQASTTCSQLSSTSNTSRADR